MPQKIRLFLNRRGLQSLRTLNIDSLDVRVELLDCALFIISLSRDADTKSVWNTLDTGFPDLLVQLRIEADIGGTLFKPRRLAPVLLLFPARTSVL